MASCPPLVLKVPGSLDPCSAGSGLRERGGEAPRPPPQHPDPGRLRYQFEDSGKRALGVGPEPLVGRFVVGSSAPIAKSGLLPLGPLQEKDSGSGASRSQEAPLPAATVTPGSAPLPPRRPAAGLGRAPLRCPPELAFQRSGPSLPPLPPCVAPCGFHEKKTSTTQDRAPLPTRVWRKGHRRWGVGGHPGVCGLRAGGLHRLQSRPLCLLETRGRARELVRFRHSF